jgi:hypothetical protein
VTRNSESKTTLKTNSLDLLFWIFWCTEQEHTFNISHRKSQEHELSAHILFKCLPFSFLCWIWKVFNAQICPHLSNITPQRDGRYGHFELSVCMVRQLDYYVTICWWRAFLWQIFTGICWIVLISLLFSDVESLGIVTSNAPKLTLRPENRDLYVFNI